MTAPSAACGKVIGTSHQTSKPSRRNIACSRDAHDDVQVAAGAPPPPRSPSPRIVLTAPSRVPGGMTTSNSRRVGLADRRGRVARAVTWMRLLAAERRLLEA